MDNLLQLLISIFGQESVDAMTDEQKQSAMEFVESLKDLAEGWQGEDGSVDVDKIKNPALKDFLSSTLGKLGETSDALTAAQGDVEKHKGEADAARSEAEAAKGEAESAKTEAASAKGATDEVRKQYALKGALKDSGAHNPDLLSKHLDMGKVTVDEDGNVDGLDDQVETLKKSDPYLFKGDDSSDGGDEGSGNKGFNPATNKKKAGWQPGMKIDQAYNLQRD